MGIFHDLFGGFFDFDGDGKTTGDEEWIAYNILEDTEKEDNESDNASHYPILHDDFNSSDELADRHAWREFCEDGSDFNVDPDDYETEEEYDDALEEAKNAWRENCTDGRKLGVHTENYETEKEYEKALKKAKNAWRYYCEDGSDFDVDPDDYETEEEYEDALEKAKNDCG